MSMSNLMRVLPLRVSVMAPNSRFNANDRPDADDQQSRGVGMAHVTVVPTNFEPDDR